MSSCVHGRLTTYMTFMNHKIGHEMKYDSCATNLFPVSILGN